jgi:nitrite reductase/ring-hydroxylating ferredoxin subunit
MIPNQWYAILESRDLRSRRPLGIRRLGKDLVLWRDARGSVICMDDRCPHRGVALSIGRVGKDYIACRYHGFRYNPAGQCFKTPCNGPDSPISQALKVKTYTTREVNGFIWLWAGEDRAELPPLPWIDELPSDPSAGLTRSEYWPFNYARILENNLDAHHWAFLHGSIMVGVGEHVDNYHVEADDVLIKSWGTLRKAGNPKGRGWDFRVFLRIPNMLMIQVTPHFRSLVITTPVDEATSWVAIRCFQTYTRLPIFRWLIDFYCIHFLFAVPQYRQDFPVFHAQTPIQTGIGVSKLVAADKAIAKYLHLRDRLIREAAGASPADEANALPHTNGKAASRTLPLALPSAAHALPNRNSHRGVEGSLGRAFAWAGAYVAFPLLLPSVAFSFLLNRWYGRD